VSGVADERQEIAAIVEKRTRGWLPLSEWGPTCHGCGADEFRIDGYCSIECRDHHDDENIAALAASLAEREQQVAALVGERDALLAALRETEDTLAAVGIWLSASPEPTDAVVAAIDQRIGENRAVVAASSAVREPGGQA
jgi:hypothetical protein